MLSALKLASGIIKDRSPKPILLSVHIEADADKVVVRTTNLEMSIRCEIHQVQVERAGVCCIKCTTITQCVDTSTSETVAFDTVGDNVVISDDDSESKIPSNKVSDFPPDVSHVDDPIASVTLPLATLAAVLKRAMPFTLKSTIQVGAPMIGLLLKAEKGKLTVAGSDGRRLFVDSLPFIGKAAGSVIVPTMAIERLIGIEAEEVTITMSRNRVVFATDDITLATSIIDGEFPPYHRIIPENLDKTFTVSREVLVAKVKQSAGFCTEESKGVRFDLSSRGLVVTSRTPEIGSSIINVPGRYEGEAIEMVMNPTYLLGCLNGGMDEVKLRLIAPNFPFLVEDGTTATQLVMPINPQA
jgi:DNA polymerase-3 subunit beta